MQQDIHKLIHTNYAKNNYVGNSKTEPQCAYFDRSKVTGTRFSSLMPSSSSALRSLSSNLSISGSFITYVSTSAYIVKSQILRSAAIIKIQNAHQSTTNRKCVQRTNQTTL